MSSKSSASTLAIAKLEAGERSKLRLSDPGASMKTQYSILISTIIALTTVAFGCAQPAQGVDESRWDLLVAQRNYEEVVATHAAHAWRDEVDVRRLMAFVDAAVESRRPLPDVLMTSSSAPARYARAYRSLLHGDLTEAYSGFNALRETGFPAWGLIGLSEYALYTGNVCYLGHVRSLLAAENIADTFIWANHYYGFHYLLLTSQYDDALGVLPKIPFDSELLAAQEIQIRLKDNNFALASSLLETAYGKFGRTPGLINMEATLIASQHGFDRSTAFLEGEQLRASHWEVRQLYAFHYLDSTRPDAHAFAASEIHEIALARPHDLVNLVVSSDILLELGFSEYVGDLLDEINRRSPPPTQMPSYRLLLAKIDNAAGHLHSMRNNLAAAVEMAPLDPSINWFRFEQAVKAEDIDAAHSALSLLYAYDPHNPYTLLELLRIYLRSGALERAIEYATQLGTSVRFVNPEIAEEATQYLRGLSTQ